MNALQKSVLLLAGCLVLVFAGSVGLSWWNYGYLDLETTGLMAAMLLPLLGAAAVVVVWSSNARKAARREERPVAAAAGEARKEEGHGQFNYGAHARAG
ncbi:MAG: hypothetical protein HY719_05150 [Planctomycetes bacterium]|nr:hypothetical protein [Planctomycetota bacterium]